MAGDKTILQLPALSNLFVSDAGVAVQGGVTSKYQQQILVNLLSGILSLGSLVTFGTTIPTGGKDTDVYIRTDTNQLFQRISSTWIVIYTFPTASGTTFRYGNGAPDNSLGTDGDSYLATLSGIFYLKITGAYVQQFTMATGPAGPRGNSVLNGTGVPGSGVGFDGDFYLDTATYTIYGPKAAGAWGSGALLKPIVNTVLSGTAPPSNSTDGIDGDFFINYANYTIYGPKTAGDWGAATSLIPANVEIIEPITANNDGYYDYNYAGTLGSSPTAVLQIRVSAPSLGWQTISNAKLLDNGHIYVEADFSSGTGDTYRLSIKP